jgi:hypothetical protein
LAGVFIAAPAAVLHANGIDPAASRWIAVAVVAGIIHEPLVLPTVSVLAEGNWCVDYVHVVAVRTSGSTAVTVVAATIPLTNIAITVITARRGKTTIDPTLTRRTIPVVAGIISETLTRIHISITAITYRIAGCVHIVAVGANSRSASVITAVAIPDTYIAGCAIISATLTSVVDTLPTAVIDNATTIEPVCISVAIVAATDTRARIWIARSIATTPIATLLAVVIETLFRIRITVSTGAVVINNPRVLPVITVFAVINCPAHIHVVAIGAGAITAVAPIATSIPDTNVTAIAVVVARLLKIAIDPALARCTVATTAGIISETLTRIHIPIAAVTCRITDHIHVVAVGANACVAITIVAITTPDTHITRVAVVITDHIHAGIFLNVKRKTFFVIIPPSDTE